MPDREDPNGWEYDPDDHPIPEPYDEFYENRETRMPEWYPGWRLPPSTFGGEQPEHIAGQLSLEE